MKNKITALFLTATLFSVVCAQTNKLNAPAVNGKEKNSQMISVEDDADERMKWELKRLADPATGKIPEDARAKELAFAATLPNDAQFSNSFNKSVASNFVSRGPWNVGGTTRAFAIDAANENRLLAGTTSGGMWLSTDGGNSWTMTNTPAQLKGANCLAQDKRPNHRNKWYYGGGNPWASAGGGGNAYYLGDGLMQSSDSGLTWQPIASTAGGNPNSFSSNWQMVYAISCDYSAPDTVDEMYVARYGDIQRTVNGGTSWTTARTGGSYYTEVATTSTGVVYATLSDDGTQKGIWRSPDGIAWTKIMPANFPTAYNRIVMGINPNNENEVYFLANTPGFGKLVHDFLGDAHWNSLWKYTYVSGTGDTTGGGGTWQDLSANLPATGGTFDKFHTQDSYDMLVRVKPGNSSIVFIGGTNLYRSTSAFQDSVNTTYIGGYQEHSELPVIASYPNHHPDQHGLEFLASNPNVFISSNDGGVFKTYDNTKDTVVWVPLNNGYISTMFYTLAIDHGAANNDILCGGAQDNGTWWTNNNGTTSPWKQVHGGDGSFCAIADNASAYYFSIQNGMRLVKTALDANGNNTGYRRIDPIGGKGYLWMNPFVLDPNNNNIMYLAGGKYLWRNDDLSGISLTNQWDSISTNWVRYADSVPTANSKITTIVACKTPANRVYYGTDNKKIYRVDNANVGTPLPVSVTSTTTTAPFPGGGYVNNIAVDPQNGDNAIVVFSNYGVQSLYSTQDGGVTWARCGGNLEASSVAGPSVRWASILHVTDGTVYLVATSIGLYATDSLKGTSTVWVQQGTNTIGNVVCDMIETRESDGLVVVATHSAGMFSCKITTVLSSIKEVKSAKTDFNLINYPNPLTQVTTIEFTLEKRTAVNLKLWDECGRLVETLVDNEQMQEGKHSIQFDRKNLKSGIYYYSLTAEGKKKTNAMIIE